MTMSNGPDLNILFGDGGTGGRSSGVFEGDALAVATEAAVTAAAGVKASTVRAYIFAKVYAPSMQPLLSEVMSYKLQQSPGTLRRLMEVIKSISLREYLQRMVLSVGGGGK